MSWKRKEDRRTRAWPWILGVVLGIGGAALHLGVKSADARGDDAVVYEIDLANPLTQAEVEELARFTQEHEGTDVILRPAKAFEVPTGEDRRRRDEERAAREDAEAASATADAFAQGLYVSGSEERAPCATGPSPSLAEPGRHLLCEGSPAVAAPRRDFERVAGPAGVEAELEAYLRDLLDGVTPEEEAEGFTSSFSDASALRTLTFLEGGVVEVDFNVGIEEQLRDLHTGHASHNMLQQIYRTLFQFRDVAAVELALDGSCEAFGELIGGPCQKLDRDLWETMNSENGERVEFFTLEGGR